MNKTITFLCLWSGALQFPQIRSTDSCLAQLLQGACHVVLQDDGNGTGLHTDMTLDLFVQIVHQNAYHGMHIVHSPAVQEGNIMLWVSGHVALSCNGYSIYSVLRLQVDFHRLSLNAPHRSMHFIKLASSCKLENSSFFEVVFGLIRQRLM